MGSKYEIIGRECNSQCDDIHVFTNSLIKALKVYRKAKKMFFCAFIIRNDKYIRVVEDGKDNN